MIKEFPYISIIVPVYNVDNYLCQSLNSIISQTCVSWECILIDDGSSDNSGSICEGFAHKDTRFKVIHKENGGVSSARNLGIEKAQGKWLYFCDADDTLVPQALDILLDGEKENCQFVMAGYNNYSSKPSIKCYICKTKIQSR